MRFRILPGPDDVLGGYRAAQVRVRLGSRLKHSKAKCSTELAHKIRTRRLDSDLLADRMKK